MGGPNRGKQFEQAIKDALDEIRGAYVKRELDPSAGFAGVKNICDYIFFKTPTLYFFECKTVQGNTLNFKGGISKTQWDGLLDASKADGVVAGILLWFQDWDITVFIEINELARMKSYGAKSVNAKDIRHKAIKYAMVPGIKKRVLYKYNGIAMIKAIDEGWRGDEYEVQTKQ